MLNKDRLQDGLCCEVRSARSVHIEHNHSIIGDYEDKFETNR